MNDLELEDRRVTAEALVKGLDPEEKDKPFCPLAMLTNQRKCSSSCAWFDKYSGNCVFVVMARLMNEQLSEVRGVKF